MTDYYATAKLEFDPTTDSFRINVQTTDSETGEALNGATVSIHGPVERTEESSSGYATFTDVPKGDYDIRGSIGGYQEATTSITADDFVEA